MPITTGRKPRPRKTLVVGGGGIGKTTFAMSAPGAIGLPVEDGMNDLDGARYDVARSLGELYVNVQDLLQQPAGYYHAVIDSVDWLYRLCCEHVMTANKWPNMEALAYGKCFAAADETFWRIWQSIEALHTQRGLGLIVIAHAAPKRFADPQRESYDRWEPALRPTITERLVEWADEVFFCALKTYTQTKDAGFGREETKATGTGERVIYTEGRPAFIAKNRLRMPPEIPLLWSEYQKYMQGAAPASTGA